MRILFLSNLYPPHDLGGYEQWCQEMALALGRRGHSVHVLTSRYGTNGANPPEAMVTRSLYLQAGINRYHILGDFALRRQKERWNERELQRVFGETKPDLIVVWGMWNLSPKLPYELEQWASDRLAYYIASYWPIDEDIHREYWQEPTPGLLGSLVKTVVGRLGTWQFRQEDYPPQLQLSNAACCSRYVRDTLVQAGRLPGGSRVLYGGIDPEPFLIRSGCAHFEAEKVRLLYFGRLLPQKGVHTAIEALGLLHKWGEAKGVSLTLLGDGHPHYEAQLRALAAQQQVADRVIFAGRVGRSEIPAWLPNFDIFLFTSTWPEPFGRTIVEAMAAGLIVIGSSVGGSQEIFEHYAPDLLFQPEDAVTLATHIGRVRQNRLLQQEMVRRGRQVVCNYFTHERMAENFERWLLQLSHQKSSF